MAYKLFRGAKVYRHELGLNHLMDEVLVADGRIVAYGNNDQLSSDLPKNTVIIELEGGILLPAFFDAHLHLDQGGRYLRSLQLLEMQQKSEVMEAIKTYPRLGKKWIRGIGLHENALPSLEELDRVSMDVPVYLHTRDYHTIVLNSKAIEQIGLTNDTKFVEGGWQDIREDGSVAGVLHENATSWLLEKLPHETEEEVKQNLVSAFNELISYGILGASDGSENPSYQILKDMDDCGELGLFIEHWYRCITFNSDCLSVSPVNGKKLIVNRIKLFLDGALGSHTAWMSEPYTDRADVICNPVPDLNKLERFVEKVIRNGWGLTVHAIGDQAVEYGLNLVKENINPIVKNRLEHIQHIKASTLNMFGDVDIIRSIQPGHRIADLSMLRQRVGKKRASWSFPQKSLNKAQNKVVIGTDWPVISLNPFENLFSAITKRKNGEGVLGDELTVEEALYSMTAAPGQAAGFNEYGITEKGGLANLIWIDKTPTTDPESWRSLSVSKVFKEGVEIKKGR